MYLDEIIQLRKNHDENNEDSEDEDIEKYL